MRLTGRSRHPQTGQAFWFIASEFASLPKQIP